MVELVNNGVMTGKVGWWDATVFYKNIGKEVIKKVYKIVEKPVKKAADWVMKNPLKAVAIGVTTVGVIAAAIFIAPVAAVVSTGLLVIGVVFSTATAAKLSYSYATGGNEGLTKAVFTQDTLNLVNAGDLGGAIGSGSVDIFNTVDSLIPLGAGVKMVRKIPQLPGTVVKIVTKGSTLLESARNSTKLRIAFAETKYFVDSGGKRILQEVVKLSSGNGTNSTTMLSFLNNVPNNKNTQETLSLFSKEVEEIKGIKGSSNELAVQDKAKKLLKNIEEEEEEVEKGLKIVYLRSPTMTSVLTRPIPPNVSPQQWIHSLAGEVNRNGKATGFHHLPSSKIGKVIYVIDQPNKYGIYTAKVEINGVVKSSPSTMWPDKMTQEQIADEVEYAMDRLKPVKGNIYQGETITGFKIEFYLQPNGTYNFTPIYTP